MKKKENPLGDDFWMKCGGFWMKFRKTKGNYAKNSMKILSYAPSMTTFVTSAKRA